MVDKPVQIVRPDPDPTLLTTENLRREIANLKDLIEGRLAANDKAIELIQAATNKFRDEQGNVISDSARQLHTLIEAEIEKLAAVTTERFLGVAAQFAERDTRTDQRAGDTKLAVDAAFAAAKEATAKIEAGFTKQIDAIMGIVDTKTSNLAGGIGDIKDRMTALENRTAGINSARMDSRADGSDSRGNMALVVASAAVLVSVLFHFIK